MENYIGRWLRRIRHRNSTSRSSDGTDIVVLTANPWPKKSKSLYVTTNALKRLGRDKVHFRVINLYDYQIPFRNRETTVNKEVNRILHKMNQYKYWVITYPIWWSGVPAILKNFIDWSGFIAHDIYKNKSVLLVAACATKDKKYADKQSFFMKQQIGIDYLEFCGAKVSGCLLIHGTSGAKKVYFEKFILKLTKIVNDMLNEDSIY